MSSTSWLDIVLKSVDTGNVDRIKCKPLMPEQGSKIVVQNITAEWMGLVGQ